MIEATIGIFLLIFGALGSVQIAMYLHGSLAAYSAAAQFARTYALTRSNGAVLTAYSQFTLTSFGYLRWTAPRCSVSGSMARCDLDGQVTALVPGIQFVGGTGVSGSGAYPLPGAP